MSDEKNDIDTGFEEKLAEIVGKNRVIVAIIIFMSASSVVFRVMRMAMIVKIKL